MANFSALKSEIERRLRDSLLRISNKRLQSAMKYCLMSGGKRLRPLLALQCAEIVSSKQQNSAWPAALAVEYVHTYSLIHDDLPAMDDDDFRRGRASCHIAFGEATAILVGDAFLSDAFGLLAGAKHNPAQQCAELSLAIGSNGMVSGQLDDISLSKKDDLSLDIRHVHLQKTAKLFAASCVLGGLSVGAAKTHVELFREFGINFGLAFQLADDLTDGASLPDGMLEYYRSKASYLAKQLGPKGNGLELLTRG